MQINKKSSLSPVTAICFFNAPNLNFLFFFVQVKMRFSFESFSKIGGAVFFRLLYFRGVHFYHCYVFRVGYQVSIKNI